MTHQPLIELHALVLRLAHAAGHDPSNVNMPWREELALAAAALAGFRDAVRQGKLPIEAVTTAMGVVEDINEGGASALVRLLEALAPGSYARLLEPRALLSHQLLAFDQAS